MGATVEDAKVSVDILFEEIQEKWAEEIQSIDIVTFQKVWNNIMLIRIHLILSIKYQEVNL